MSRWTVFDERGDAAGDQVVAEVHDERLAAQKRLGDEHRVGEAAGRVLLDVLNPRAEARSVAEGGLDLLPGVADDDADVPDAGRDDRLDPVEEDRLVRHRHELLGARVSQRAQARALAAREDEAFHC